MALVVYIPRRRLFFRTAGSGLSRVHRTAVLRRPALDGLPRLCYFPGKRRGYDAVPEEHKSGIDMGRDLLRRSHVLVVCGHTMTEAMKNDIAVAQRLGITATTLEGILTVKGQGKR